jgi:hypothetical protein
MRSILTFGLLVFIGLATIDLAVSLGLLPAQPPESGSNSGSAIAKPSMPSEIPPPEPVTGTGQATRHVVRTIAIAGATGAVAVAQATATNVSPANSAPSPPGDAIVAPLKRVSPKPGKANAASAGRIAGAAGAAAASTGAAKLAGVSAVKTVGVKAPATKRDAKAARPAGKLACAKTHKLDAAGLKCVPKAEAPVAASSKKAAP